MRKKTDHNYIKKDYEIKNDIYLNNELINIVFNIILNYTGQVRKIKIVNRVAKPC